MGFKKFAAVVASAAAVAAIGVTATRKRLNLNGSAEEEPQDEHATMPRQDNPPPM